MISLLKAQFVDDTAPQAEWRFVHRLADAVYPRLNVKVQRALSVELNMSQVTRLLEQNRPQEAIAAVDLEPLARSLRDEVLPILWDLYVRAGEITLRRTGLVQKASIPESAFQQTNPHALEWAARKSSTLIVQITEETREAVRALVARGFEDGIPPKELARHLRDVVGLTKQQVLSIQNLRNKLSAQGYTRSAIDSHVKRATRSALKDRGENIARTESMSASNAGQMEAWRQGRQQGLIDPGLVKEFIVTPDDRLCHICMPLHGEQKKVDEVFSFGKLEPPVHPRCRCAIGLVPPRPHVSSDGVITEADRSSPALSRAFHRTELKPSISSISPGDLSVVKVRLENEMTRLFNSYEGLKDLPKVSRLTVHGESDLRAVRSSGSVGLYTHPPRYSSRGAKIDVADGPSRLGPDEYRWGPHVWSTSGGTAANSNAVGTFRHEYGHHVHIGHMKWEARQEWTNIWSRYTAPDPLRVGRTMAQRITQYAGTNDKELFAESFAVYVHPKYKMGDLPKDIEDFLVKQIGLRKEVAISETPSIFSSPAVPKRRWSPTDIDDIHRKVAEGWSTKRIAAHYGVSPNSITYIKMRRGTTSSPPVVAAPPVTVGEPPPVVQPPTVPPVKRKWTVDEVKDIHAKKAEGWSAKKIAEHYGVSSNSVMYILSRRTAAEALEMLAKGEIFVRRTEVLSSWV